MFKMSESLSAIFNHDEMISILDEFSRLKEKCYLDNAGSNLYPQKLIKSVSKDLLNNIYCQPHTDKYTSSCIEQIRSIILSHFDTDLTEYSVIFTSGTTHSMKLVTEAFKFQAIDKSSIGSFLYLRESHTSAIGLREIATERNIDIAHISHHDLLNALDNPTDNTHSIVRDDISNSLVVFSALNNFNGYKYPLNKLDKIKKGCLNRFVRNTYTDWYTLLDVAALVPTNKLDLNQYKPDFVCLSFYKIFGYPTGLGALIVRNKSSNLLSEKKYFGGGSVDVVLSTEDYHIKRSELHERFEDGTVSYLSIISLKHCFKILERMIPKTVNCDVMETISYHTFYLAKDLFDQLKSLKHDNGSKAVELYMDSSFENIDEQGSIIAFNLITDDGSYIGYAEFNHLAELFNINVRTGCFCNTGSCQRHLNITNKQLKRMHEAGHKCGDDFDLYEGRPTGAIRVSFAYYNTYADVDKLVDMIHKCFIKTPYKRCMRTPIQIPKIGLPKVEKQNKQKVENNFYNRLNILSENDNSKGRLRQIAIYPIKSCAAFKLPKAWAIGSKGLEYDREWMIIKDNGVCLTQKQNTRMCMLQPEIDLKGNVLVLKFLDKIPITVPLEHSEHINYNGTVCQSKICTDTVQGYDCGDKAAQWISEALETSYLRLIRQSVNDGRMKKTQLKNLSLSNQAQFLLINSATVNWLRDKIQDPTFADDVEGLTDRFRGNLIVDMDHELVERGWKKVVIGKHEFRVDSPCSRCQMVCIDQKSGMKTVEPLRTISEQFKGKLRFGIYLTYLGSTDVSGNIIRNDSNVVAFCDESS